MVSVNIGAMVVWLHCSTHIHVFKHLSITIQGMTLDQPLTAHERTFLHAPPPIDFNEISPIQTAQCPSKRPKMVEVFVASFNVY